MRRFPKNSSGTVRGLACLLGVQAALMLAARLSDVYVRTSSGWHSVFGQASTRRAPVP